MKSNTVSIILIVILAIVAALVIGAIVVFIPMARQQVPNPQPVKVITQASPPAGVQSTDTPQTIPTPTTEAVNSPEQEEATLQPTDAASEMPTPTIESVAPLAEQSSSSQFWVEMQDPQYGLGFAVPCYWEVNFPDPYPTEGSGIAYSIRNYNEDFVASFPRGEGIFENGGIKIDMNFMHGPSWGAVAGASSLEFVNILYSNDTETTLIAIEERIINNQFVLLVTTSGNFGIGQFYLFTVSPEIYFIFAPNTEAIESPDVLAILNSIAATANIDVAIPNQQPDNPPQGMIAPCLGITEVLPTATPIPDGCQAVSFATLEELTAGLEDNFTKADINNIVSNYMNETIAAGLWRSEGQVLNRDDLFHLLSSTYYRHHVNSIAVGNPSPVTFTTDRSQFPPLGGMPLEGMFGPDVNIVEINYSEGWGTDGSGAAFLFIAQDNCGSYYWHGLLYSDQHFDK